MSVFDALDRTSAFTASANVSVTPFVPPTPKSFQHHFAEGATAESTFVMVSNATTNPNQVRFTVVYDDGTRDVKEYALAGSAVLTVRVGDHFPIARTQRLSVLVESMTDGAPITVE